MARPILMPQVGQDLTEGKIVAINVKLGDMVTFDIQGRKLDARVSSVRHVDWRNSRTGFIVLFRPGALDNAPQTFVGAIDGPTAEPARSRFQREIVDRFPNVSVIDVADIVRGVSRILSNITLAVSFIGSPETVQRGLAAFIESTQLDELMITAHIHDQPARLRSIEIVSKVREDLL